MPMELCAPMVSETELSCVLVWLEDPRVAGIGQSETALLLGNDEAEEPEIPQSLDELSRLRRLSIPAP